jgi:hypothetical protein
VRPHVRENGHSEFATRAESSAFERSRLVDLPGQARRCASADFANEVEAKTFSQPAASRRVFLSRRSGSSRELI